MRNILTSKIWQLFLAIAFLSTQFASAHVHLASNHDHDGHDHTHSQIVHTHSQLVQTHDVASHHVDAFDSDEDAHTTQIVEFCQDWTVKCGKWLNDLESQAVLVSSFPCCEQSLATLSYVEKTSDYRCFHFRSKVKARAPPILFSSHV